MPLPALRALGLIALLLIPSVSTADDALDIGSINERARAVAGSAGNDRERETRLVALVAEVEALAPASDLERRWKHAGLSSLLQRVARLQIRGGRSVEAERSLMKALAQAVAADGAEKTLAAECLNTLAGLYANSGRLQLALETYERGIMAARAEEGMGAVTLSMLERNHAELKALLAGGPASRP